MALPTYAAEPVARLIEELGKLPGIGPKSAQRLTYFLLRAPAEQALALEGIVVDKSNKKPIADARITLMLGNFDYNGFYTTESDDAGRFRLENVDFSDSTLLIWQRTRPQRPRRPKSGVAA